MPTFVKTKYYKREYKMGTKSVATLIFEAIQTAGKPLNFQGIRGYIYRNYHAQANTGTIRQVLYKVTKQGIVQKIKFDGVSSFYGKPEWVVDGKFIPELNFDP